MGLLAEILTADQDNNVTWWASSFDHYRKKDREIKESTLEIKKNYTIRFIKGITYKSNLSLKRLFHHMHEGRAFVKKASQCTKPDVIVCAMPTLEMAYYASIYAKKNNIPFLVDIRDMFPDMYVDFVPSKYRGIVKVGIIPYKCMLRKALRNATALVATSEKFLCWGARYAGREISDRDKVYYVSYPDMGDVNHDEEDFWKQKGLSQDDFICCFFGKFGYTVDLEMVMRAAKLLNGKSKAKFVICGEGEKLNEYKKIIEGCNNVLFPSWVNKDQIYELGKISSIGLLAYKPGKNYEDSMPNKFCEYLALGQALLIEPKGMMLNLAIKNNCGLHFNDEFELADRIKMLESDRKLLEEMQENARNLYEDKFCSEKVYKEYAAYVEQLACEEIYEI